MSKRGEHGVTTQDSQLIHVVFKDWTVLRSVFLIIVIGLCAALAVMAGERIADGDPQMLAALIGGGVAALATSGGALPVLFTQKFSQRTYDASLGFGAGVMLAATIFSLIIPALSSAKSGGAGNLGAAMNVAFGVLIGMLLIMMLERQKGGDQVLADPSLPAGSLRRAWLFASAVALHNIPEGLAIGVAYGGIDISQANVLATGISIQDVPEGLVVALALRSVGYGRAISFGAGVFSGLVEPIAALLGATLITIAASLLPWGLAIAAGAMLFVICRDVVPESRRNQNCKLASICLGAGFVLMTVLDTALS
jgi:ZIP family zinc transporter